MGLATNVLTALLVFVAATTAIPAHFPHGKTVIYKYYADVKAGTIEPVPYASQFGLQSVLYVKHDTSDPTLNNAYYIKLSNSKFGLFNGQSAHYERVSNFNPILEASKALEEPFLVVYDENGKFQGVKFQENEPIWSKNVKQGIASALQLDFSLIKLQTQPIKPHSFIVTENTIHGDCQVTYDVHPKDQVNPQSSNIFVVTKLYEPNNCTNFVQKTFDHLECEKCYVEPENSMSTASRRVFEVENQGDEVLITKLIGHGVVNYFPWQARSEAHYLLNNQTLVLETVVPQTQINLPVVNFQTCSLVRDVSFQKHPENTRTTSEDLTQGRHLINLELLIPKLKKMLIEAADYLEENHLEMKEPDWKHGQTVNRIFNTMKHLDVKSLEEVFNSIQNPKTPKEVSVKNIFLQIVPTVGTAASCLFTKNVIVKHKVSDGNALMMLHKLPMHIQSPNERLLLDLEDLLKLEYDVSKDVKVASILCFSRIIHKTYKDKTIINQILINKYLKDIFYEHIKNEPTYQMKLVYILALKNVQLKQIHPILEPIIRGDLVISDKPNHIRVAAIWAIQKTIINDLRYAHNLLWPVLADTSLPLTVRIAAYNVLINQLPHMGRIMNLYWLMVYEKNEHLYNYHVSTIKGLANSVDPCLRPVREMARKILRFTRIRNVPGPLSVNYCVDYVNPKYEFGETAKASLILDELTGIPHVGSVEHIYMFARKRTAVFGIYWSVTGSHEVMKMVTQLLPNIKIAGNIANENVKNILKKVAKDMPLDHDINVDLTITINDQVVQTLHLDKNNVVSVFDKIENVESILSNANMNIQNVLYDTFYEMQVPTDMGLQAVLSTRIPVMSSAQINTHITKDNAILNLGLKLDARLWRHGEYFMSIYNPIADVWQSIRRVTSNDIAVPLDINIVYNKEMSSLTVTSQRLPVNKYSISGLLTHVKNYVTITDDDNDELKKSCATCHHHEVVTKGTEHKKNYQSTYDSEDAGLQYSMSIFDCESTITPTTQKANWIKAMSSENKNTWDSKTVQWIMGIREQLWDNLISPEIGSCGNLIKIQPSILHPTSSIDVSLRGNIENVDHMFEKMHPLSSKKLNVHGTIDVRAASTNTTVRSWDLNVNFETSQGYVNNNLKVQITRVTPGENKLKICIDGQHNYPIISVDPLKLGMTKEEVNTKVSVTMGHTNDDKCVRDDTVVTLTMKSELSEEQKKQMSYDSINGACTKDIQKEIFSTKQGHIPKTENCIRETILYTTMRKYTANIVYKKIPQTIVSKLTMLEDSVRAIFSPHVSYNTNVEPGKIKVIVECPVETDNVNVSVVTPTHGYEITELPFGNKLATMWMLNTHFPLNFLNNLLTEQMKICTIYPQVLLTADKGVIPYTVSDQWTLVSGDYVHNTYAVFVKVVQNNVFAKVFIGEHVIEIVPKEGKPVVTINGNIVKQIEKGVVEPHDALTKYTFKITNHYEHLIVQTHIPFEIFYTPNSLTIALDTSLQGLVSGVCGHLDNTHKEKLPKVYSTIVL
ncbi:PREDICTED: vitellogenin-6-like [Polistes dominula]|uniref:Vitellogenin-6-like n=1 Tax=Polistes dominula TaxID=743375 RepID=A0ABM1I7X2_POLDO|nr:PREDICTED: vitellogenin-6-like [Polistes dominula]